MEIKQVYVKKRSQFGKQCIFDIGEPTVDVDIPPNPADTSNYILRTHCHVGVQHSKQFASHEVQTLGTTAKNTGMYHFEGGWPREINPRDEETIMRFRKRVEKSDNWAPKLRKLFELMEHSVRQNGAVNIYEHYFDDMIPTELVQPLGLRTVNVYVDPEKLKRPVTAISWTPDSGSRIAVSYCFLDFGRQQDYSNTAYIWQVDNPNEPYMALEPPCPCMVCEFNTRDPSVLASGLMTGQVCNWDIRTGKKPVQFSHLQFSHRDYANGVKWLPTKSNTEFFSTSADGRAMWWDTRQLKQPTEILMFDFENPNEPDIDRSIGVSSLNYGPMVGTKFMFGMENGIIVTGSRKAKTYAEKLAVKFDAHFGPVNSVDRNVFNPSVFLTVGDWTARVWVEDTREGCLVSTPYLLEYPTGGCWNKERFSVFYVTTASGHLLAWDLLQSLREPVFILNLCDERLTSLAPCEEGAFIAVGNSIGKVYLVESTDYLRSFDRKDRAVMSEYIERCSKLTKAVDGRLKEIRLVRKIAEEEMEAAKAKERMKVGRKTVIKQKDKERATVKSEPRPSKEKRRSGTKERKRVRDESPTLIEAEQRYFEMVQKELEVYATESDPDLIPVQQVPTKKQDRKPRRESKTKSDSKDADTKKGRGRRAVVRESLKERSKSRRTRAKQKSSLDVPKRVSTDDRLTNERSYLTTTPSKLTLEESTKKRKKERKAKIAFTLPVPCKGEICKPEVCCWRTGKKKRGIRRGRSSMDRKSLTKSTDKLSLGSLKHRKKKILREMLEPPSELTPEAERARRELRRASSRGRQRRREIIRRFLESREQISEEQEYQYDQDEDLEEEQVFRWKKEKIKRKPVVLADPCSPPKAKSIVEEFSSILGIPLTESGEEKIKGKVYLDEYETIRGRVYPRLSEYHRVE